MKPPKIRQHGWHAVNKKQFLERWEREKNVKGFKSLRSLRVLDSWLLLFYSYFTLILVLACVFFACIILFSPKKDTS